MSTFQLQPCEPAPPKPVPQPRGARMPKKPRLTEWRPMTAEEITHLTHLVQCRFAPATWDKRFVRDLNWQVHQPWPFISERQAQQIARLRWRYRKQLRQFGIDPGISVEAGWS